MKIFLKGRFFFWLLRELTDKYTKFFFLGLLIGVIAMISVLQIGKKTPALSVKQYMRIAAIGDYTASNIPEYILSQISTGLTKLDENGSPSASLAASWEATDSGKVYIFHLKPDVTWHDGTTLTAKDINYNIRGVTIETPDDQTVTFTIDMEYSPFPAVVARPIFLKGLVGVGSYKVSKTKIKAGQISSLTIVPVNGKGQTKEYKFYKTDSQAILAYQLGEVDEIDNLVSLDPSFYEWKNTDVRKTVNTNRMITLFFNMNDPFLQEKDVRHALAYALPPFEGEERAYSPIQKTSWAYTDTVKHYDLDLETAQNLLDQSNLGTSSAVLTLHTFSPYLDTATKIADNWEKVGVKTEIKVENTVPPDYQILLTARDLPSDPDQYAFWHSTQKQMNVSNYVDVKIDKLLEDGREELNVENRKKIYTDFQKRLVDEAPALFLYYPAFYNIVRK